MDKTPLLTQDQEAQLLDVSKEANSKNGVGVCAHTLDTLPLHGHIADVEEADRAADVHKAAKERAKASGEKVHSLLRKMTQREQLPLFD